MAGSSLVLKLDKPLMRPRGGQNLSYLLDDAITKVLLLLFHCIMLKIRNIYLNKMIDLVLISIVI